MKVFFDTNVYVAEALLGETAEALVQATQRANWRIVTNTHVLDEVRRVLTEYFGFPVRFAALTRHRIGRRASVFRESERGGELASLLPSELAAAWPMVFTL